MNSLKVWVLAGLLLMGSPFLWIGLSEAADVYTRLASSQRAEAVVIGNHLQVDRRDGLEERAYLPELRFASADGAQHVFTDRVGSLPADYDLDEHVAVLYDPAHPEDARILSWKRLWLVPVLLSSVGLLPFAVALLVLRRL